MFEFIGLKQSLSKYFFTACYTDVKHMNLKIKPAFFFTLIDGVQHEAGVNSTSDMIKNRFFTYQ